MTSYSLRDMNIVQAIDRAEKDLQDIKSAQYIGKKTLETKKNVSGILLKSKDGWGFPLGPGDPVTYQYVYTKVTFKAGSQLSPYGRLTIELYGPDMVTRLTDSSAVKILSYVRIITDVEDGILSWRINIQGPPSPVFYVRFVVWSSDMGLISTVQV